MNNCSERRVTSGRLRDNLDIDSTYQAGTYDKWPFGSIFQHLFVGESRKPKNYYRNQNLGI